MIYSDTENLAGAARPTTPEAIREESQRQAETVQALRLRLLEPRITALVRAVRILN